MYTAKSLSYYRNAPSALMQQPEGPNSGCLVIQDDESTGTLFFGLAKDPRVTELPFPQNKLVSIKYRSGSAKRPIFNNYDIYFIPVVNQPLSSDLYYAIKADGKHQGESYASTKKKTGTLSSLLPSLENERRAFDPQDIYQQFQFSTSSGFLSTKLKAKSVAPDGQPPHFLRQKGTMTGETPRNLTLKEVSGVNTSLRAHLPDFNFPISQQLSNPLVVGTWYCPFMFVIEGSENERVQNSVFYEMTLEQRWERVFSVNNNGYGHGKKVTVDSAVQTEVVRIGGQVTQEAYMDNVNKVMWFKNRNGNLGLSKLIVDRMMWEEERVGWIKGKERIVKEEVFDGLNGWKSFGCYVLVESFVLKRNDGRVVMTYDFKHTHQVRSKWE